VVGRVAIVNPQIRALGIAQQTATRPADWGRLYERERQGIIDTLAQHYEEWDKDLTLIKVANRAT
jgi:hypothetical protein